MIGSHKIEHYILGQTIGVGGSAKVKVAQHELTGNKVAIKIISKAKIREMRVGSRVKREISMLRYFNHPNIIKMYEVLETQNDIFLITEYAPQGDLTRLFCKDQKLTEKDAKFFFRQIIAAVEYCHSNLVAHRDLKPENILLDEHNTIKLADFGLANLMKDGKLMKTDCGSPNYVAPEVISRKRYCGSEADAWSCGVILYTLLAGTLPFDETSIQSLFKKIVKGKFHIPGHFSKEVTDLIHKMLNPDPTKRVKIHEVKYHEWMRHTDMMYLDPREIRPYKNELQRIKNDVLEKIKTMQFNFGGLSPQKIKEIIEKRKECSFTIGFNMLYDEMVKKDVTSKLVKTQQGKTCEKLEDLQSNKDSFKKKMLESCKTVSTVPETAQSLFEKESKIIVTDDSGIFGSVVNGTLKKALPAIEHKKSEQDPHLETEQWHYGLQFALRPDKIMTGITETLIELNTMYFVKSGPYKMKCFYHIHKEFAVCRPSPLGLKALNNGMPRNNSICGYPGQPPMKEDKYSKDEIAFKIQIYGLPNKKDHVVDIQRIKGHAIIFLDYCQKFVQVLERKLSVDPN